VKIVSHISVLSNFASSMFKKFVMKTAEHAELWLWNCKMRSFITLHPLLSGWWH